MAQNGPQRPPPVQYGNTLSYCTIFLGMQVIFESQMGKKYAQNMPQPLAWVPKITPKWTKMAPKGPKIPHKAPPVRYGNTLPHCTTFGVIQVIWGSQTGEK